MRGRKGVHELAALSNFMSSFLLTCSGWMGGHSDLDLGNLGAGWQARSFPFGLFCMILFRFVSPILRSNQMEEACEDTTSELMIATIMVAMVETGGWCSGTENECTFTSSLVDTEGIIFFVSSSLWLCKCVHWVVVLTISVSISKSRTTSQTRRSSMRCLTAWKLMCIQWYRYKHNTEVIRTHSWSHGTESRFPTLKYYYYYLLLSDCCKSSKISRIEQYRSLYPYWYDTYVMYLFCTCTVSTKPPPDLVNKIFFALINWPCFCRGK